MGLEFTKSGLFTSIIFELTFTFQVHIICTASAYYSTVVVLALQTLYGTQLFFVDVTVTSLVPEALTD